MAADDTRNWMALSLSPGLGLGGLWQLLHVFNSPAEIFARPNKLQRELPRLRASQIAGLAHPQRLLEHADRQLDELVSRGGKAISYVSPEYPESLRQLVDPPPVLYLLGNTALLSAPSVAMVGSRAASRYGRRVAERLAADLGRGGFTIISGLALGIDTESHRGALRAKAGTVAVLGCGLDVIYTRQNKSLSEQISAAGLIVSEYPLGTQPEGFRFPQRNRIIAALAKGVVIVEAARKSGSLITAQIALDLGKEIFAVPGQIDSFKSEGCHLLLQQGAKLVASAEDVVVELGVFADPWAAVQEEDTGRPEIDEQTQSLLSILEPYPLPREELLLKSGLDSSRLSELMLYLELQGLVEVHPGGRYSKIG